MNSISKHHGERSWLNGFKKEYIKKHGRVKSNLLHKLRNPNIFEFIGNNLGSKSEKVYKFFVYDFFDLGILYYIKKNIKKLD